MTPIRFIGLDALATAVVLLDMKHVVRYVNPAAENLLAISAKNIVGMPLDRVITDPELMIASVNYASENNCTYTQHELPLTITGHARLEVSCTVTPTEIAELPGFLIELSPLQQQLRIAREERLMDQSTQTRELIRNLAHEIKNPLGALRGAAQLLDRELERPELHEYTQVIMKEADRLQSLMDRLLTPHRLPQVTHFNIHEAMERVRSLLLAEFPKGITIFPDYDVSLPSLMADREQIIQALLNIARNGAQAMQGKGRIILRTRVARRVTLAKKMHRLALLVNIIDNGPGIPEELRDKIFFPLVSGREGGHGIGLTIAQTFVSQHHGTIEVESRPGETRFSILFPISHEVDNSGGK
ncbi:MAG TPA: nitrogen regulation protein NR(II) [Burkholderiales bacterium]|jgi:two-component system, NtrC family, nitrogen regulation sensor histidine kinase GlnL